MALSGFTYITLENISKHLTRVYQVRLLKCEGRHHLQHTWPLLSKSDTIICIDNPLSIRVSDLVILETLSRPPASLALLSTLFASYECNSPRLQLDEVNVCVLFCNWPDIKDWFYRITKSCRLSNTCYVYYNFAPFLDLWPMCVAFGYYSAPPQGGGQVLNSAPRERVFSWCCKLAHLRTPIGSHVLCRSRAHHVLSRYYFSANKTGTHQYTRTVWSTFCWNSL